jgi:hypothetical protein
VLLASALVVAGSLVVAEGQATVGDLLMNIAESREVPAPTAEQASSHLRALGFAVPSRNLEDPLTEGILIEIAGAFGVKVTTSTPEATVNTRQVDSFMAAFRTELSGNVAEGSEGALGTDSPGNNGNGADPLEKGKGKKKGLRTPSDPA